MNQANTFMRCLFPGLCVLLALACAGCGSRTQVRNVHFPPGSDYYNSQYNVNVVARDIGLNRTQVIVSIYEQGRKPYLKREYECIVHRAEELGCAIKWDSLEDLEILLKVGECVSCASHELGTLPKLLRTLELHFMYDEEAGTFTEAPNSAEVPHKWDI